MFVGDPSAWRHGYDLAKRAALSSGTLYPLLIRLHERGWLEARWEEADRPGKPARHVYRLTAAGLARACENESGPLPHQAQPSTTVA